MIATHIIRDFPEYFPYYSMKEYRYNNITQPNRNLLLRRDPTVDGMKTGYTEAAGYCLLATAQREFPNLGAAGGAGKRRILTVVLNTTSMEARANESQRLLNWGFQAFDTLRLFDDGKPIATVPVWKGTEREAKLAASGALFVSVPKGEGAKLQTKIERTDPLVAPLAKGQRVGTIKVATAAGAPVLEVPLTVMEGGRAGGPPRPRLGRDPALDQVTIGETRAMNIPHTLCYLNGEYLPLSRGEDLGARPRLHLRRRHLRGGAGLREEAVPLRGAPGPARAQLAKLRIDNPHSREQWLERCRKLIAALFEHGGAADQLVYIQVTRGVAMRDHVMPLGIAPTVFMMASPMKPASGEQRHQGVACVSARDFRWERGDIKSISLLGNVLARQISADRDALETIMFRDGFLTEAAASNVWVVHEGAVLGPPKSEHVLEGIRYELIKELCEECGIAYNLRPIPEGEVNAADEILLSSATKEILPVTTLDGDAVGHGALRGKPGPVYARLYEAYQRAKQTQSI